MKKTLVSCSLFGAGLLAGFFLHGKTDPREALMQADRDFDKATAEKGVEGWVSYFAENGQMYGGDGNLIQGRDAIRKLMAPGFANPKNSLRWGPTFAAISKSGDLGYTTGKSAALSRPTER